MTFAVRPINFLGYPANSGVIWYVETTVGNCSITLNTDGTVSYTGNMSGPGALPPSTGSDNWYYPTTTNIGNNYWVKFVNTDNLWTSGGLTSGTIYSLSSSRLLGWGTGPITKSVDVFFYYDSAGANLAGQCQITD